MKMELIPGDFSLRQGLLYRGMSLADPKHEECLVMTYLPTGEQVTAIPYRSLLLHDLIYAAEQFLNATKKLPNTYAGTTISEGTHIADDIFDKMATFITNLPPKTLSPSQLQLWASLVEEWQTCDVLDKLPLLNEDIFNLFNDLSPEGTYFGAHIGDGALFGFWSMKDLETDVLHHDE